LSYLSPYKIYFETDNLIENFVNDWYLTTNMFELGDRLKCIVGSLLLRHFFPFVRVTLKFFRNAVCVRFDFVSCHLNEEEFAYTLETSTKNTALLSHQWSNACTQ